MRRPAGQQRRDALARGRKLHCVRKHDGDQEDLLPGDPGWTADEERMVVSRCALLVRVTVQDPLETRDAVPALGRFRMVIGFGEMKGDSPSGH